MSSNNNNDNVDTNDNDDGGLINGQPFAWILIPLFIIFIVGIVLTFIRIRRHRARRAQQQWPGQRPRVFAPSGHMFFPPEAPRGVRRSPWHGTRSQEGLNELGEAPPPYEGKKEVRESNEMQDLEAGTGRPPAYPAAPGPAVTTPGARAS